MKNNEDLFKNMLDLFANPLFRKGFFEFTSKVQHEGIEAAKRFWDISDYSEGFPYSGDMLERFLNWHEAAGFVSCVKHKELLQENAALKTENKILRSIINDFQCNLFNQGGEKAQQVYHDLIDKQLKMNAEATNTFFEAIRQFKATS